MRILQILLPEAGEYERKSQRIDFTLLAAAGHEVLLVEPSLTREGRASIARVARASSPTIAHVYGPDPLPASMFVGFPVPFVADGVMAKKRFSLRRPSEPARIVSPIKAADGRELLPEAVEDHWFDRRQPDAREIRVVGMFGPSRPDVKRMFEQSAHRMHRFRDDVRWELFDEPPTPATLATVDCWVDPTNDPHDFDGFVAEASVSEKSVVATRMPLNRQRLEEGRTGWLVPPGDPNELTHAILAALFKPEVAVTKIEAARQTAGKYRSRQRLRLLGRLYENPIPTSNS